MAKDEALETFLGFCRALCDTEDEEAGHGRRLAVLAAVAASVARDNGLAPTVDQMPLLGHSDPAVDAELTSLPVGWKRPELLSAVCDATQPAAGRRSSGSFYTPQLIAERVTQEVLDRVHGSPGRPMKVCDPAAGGGAFLVAAGRYLVKRGFSAKQIVEDCLFGVDLDPVAVVVAQAALTLLGWDMNGPPQRVNMVLGNALLSAHRVDLEAWASAEDADDQLSFFDEGKPALGSGLGLKRQLDAWLALRFWPEDQRIPTPESLLEAALSGQGEQWSIAKDIRVELGFIQWDLLTSEGFDAVIGNPPFLNQLEVATSRKGAVSAFLRAEFGGVAAGYADSANLFLALAMKLTRPGGAFGMILPESVMAARDAAVLRSAIAAECSLGWIWRAVDKVFNANVQVCAVAARRELAVGWLSIGRAAGRGVETLPSLTVESASLRSSGTWSWIFSDTSGIPDIDVRTGQLLGELCSATADFRDQFYGLVPYVKESSGAGLQRDELPLITVGLIDPLRSLWGLRDTRFAKTRYERPVVQADALLRDPKLGSWASARLVPKLLLSTQTRVLEVLVDESGEYLPSIPTISIMCDRKDQWRLAAALASPVLTAWALRHFAGAALSPDAIKLSAKQVMKLPLPDPGVDWDRAADAARRASFAVNELEWLQTLDEMARLTCLAYGMKDEATSELMEWWKLRLPPWDRGQKRKGSARG